MNRLSRLATPKVFASRRASEACSCFHLSQYRGRKFTRIAHGSIVEGWFAFANQPSRKASAGREATADG
jgi:hypothetical protein